MMCIWVSVLVAFVHGSSECELKISRYFEIGFIIVKGRWMRAIVSCQAIHVQHCGKIIAHNDTIVYQTSVSPDLPSSSKAS